MTNLKNTQEKVDAFDNHVESLVAEVRVDKIIKWAFILMAAAGILALIFG